MEPIRSRIESLPASRKQKEALGKLVEPLLGKIVGRREVMMVAGCSAATGTKYISMLKSGGVIEPAVGMGKGKYRFKTGD